MPGRGHIRMGWRLDLLTLGTTLLVSPVTFPMVATADKGRMCGCNSRRTELPRTMETGTTAPLPVGELESAVARHGFILRNTEAPDFGETLVAGPTLITRAVVRVRGDVVLDVLDRLLDLLCVYGRQPPQRQGVYENHTTRGQYASSFFANHGDYSAAFRLPGSTRNDALTTEIGGQRIACADLVAATIFAAREMGTAKFEPVKSDRIAKFTPITFPLASNTGPPEPPWVVGAS